LLRVRDRERAAVAFERTGVTDLPAAFRVERRLVEHDRALLARGELRDLLPVPVQSDDSRLLLQALVAGEGALGLSSEAFLAGAELARGACAIALHGHLRLEPLLVDRKSALARDVRGQVHREPVRAVE